jgi:hypothetical protein
VLRASSPAPASRPGPAAVPAPAAWTALAAWTRFAGHPARWQPGTPPLSRLGQTPAGHNQRPETQHPGTGRRVPRIYGSGNGRPRDARGLGRPGRQPSPDHSQGTARRGPSTSAPPRPRTQPLPAGPVVALKSAPCTHSAQDAVTVPVVLCDRSPGRSAAVLAGEGIAARRRPDPAAGYRQWEEQSSIPARRPSNRRMGTVALRDSTCSFKARS